MKLPICTFDAKNAVLCPQCEGKVESGELTKADVDAAIALARIGKTASELENFTLFSCKEFDGNYVISLAKNDTIEITVTVFWMKTFLSSRLCTRSFNTAPSSDVKTIAVPSETSARVIADAIILHGAPPNHHPTDGAPSMNSAVAIESVLDAASNASNGACQRPTV